MCSDVEIMCDLIHFLECCIPRKIVIPIQRVLGLTLKLLGKNKIVVYSIYNAISVLNKQRCPIICYFKSFILREFRLHYHN